jgi:hypothetical protein
VEACGNGSAFDAERGADRLVLEIRVVPKKHRYSLALRQCCDCGPQLGQRLRPAVARNRRGRRLATPPDITAHVHERREDPPFQARSAIGPLRAQRAGECLLHGVARLLAVVEQG